MAASSFGLFRKAKLTRGVALTLSFALVGLLMLAPKVVVNAEATHSPLAVWLVKWTTGITPTDQWVNFYSQSSYLDGQPLPVGAVVQAYNPRGVLAGQFTVTTQGWYGLMPVYGDDPNTPQDEGLRPGEVVSFTINGLPARTMGPDTPIWTTNGDLKQVNLVVSSVTPTNLWVNFYSQNTSVNGQLVPVGTLIEAFDPRGKKCGEAIVNHAGWYGLLTCYGADPNAPQQGGAQPGDTITFRIDGAVATAEGPDSATWTANGDVHQVDLAVNVPFTPTPTATSTSPSQTPTRTPTTTQTNTPGPSPTPTRTPTVTATSTQGPSLTPSSTSSPTATPTQTATPVSGVITPGGGTISATGPETVTVDFPAGAVSEDVTVQITFSGTVPATGALMGVGASFIITAHNSSNQPVTQFAVPISITVGYPDADLIGMDESQLKLYYWDSVNWVAVPTIVDPVLDTLTVSLNHLTEFSALGPAQRKLYLPLITR